MINFNTTPPNRLSFNLATFVRIFVLAAFLVVSAQSQASAEQWIDCTFVNNSGETITELYFVPSTAKDLGQNFLSAPLPNGYNVSARYISGYEYDVMVVFPGDNNYILYMDQLLTGQTQFLIEYGNGQIRIKNFGQD